MKTAKLNPEERHIVDLIVNDYIKVYGIEKWNGLSGQEQHDVIMTVVADLLKNLEK